MGLLAAGPQTRLYDKVVALCVQEGSHLPRKYVNLGSSQRVILDLQMAQSYTHTNASVPERTQRSVASVLESLRDKWGALLPILHAIQVEYGYIPEETVPIVADALNQTRAEVHGPMQCQCC